MKDVNALLDAAKRTCTPVTDLALAQKLGVVPSAVSNWRNGRALPDIVAAEKLANMAGIKPLSVVAMINEQREISRDAKAVWRRLASAAVVLLMLGMAPPGRATVLSIEASRKGQETLNISRDRHYAKWRAVQAICAKVRGLLALEPCHACTA